MNNKILKIIILVVIILLIIIGFIYLSKPKNVQNINQNPNQAPSSQNVAPPQLNQPISSALERVTKKPFGIKVSPGNSPISPERFSGYHTGVDFEILPGEENIDVPIFAICSGQLVLKKQATGYGGIAVQSCQIDNQDVTIIYGHLRLSSIEAKIGDNLSAGEKIAVLGTGYSSETDGERKHLHLAIHKGTNIDLRGYVQTPTELDGWIDILKYLGPSMVVPPEIIWGDITQKVVIFTFDAGAGTQSLQIVLDALKKENLKATFFLTGKWAEQNPEMVKQISEAGHEIFNHTYSHPHLTTLTDEQIISELTKADEVISKIIGKSTKPYFRPPYGESNDHVLKIAAEVGYQSVRWTIDALDWEESSGRTAQQVKDRILNNLKPGTIYIMHIGDNLTGQVIDELLSKIKEQGYFISSLSRRISK